MQRKKIHDINKKEEPDNELLVWEKWIQIRKEDTTTLAKKLDRPPVDLTMNLLDQVREEKEWKIVLENAKISKKPTVRGHLWEQPLRLKQGCYCKPAYEVQRTRAEMGKPSVIEHINVPDYIQKVEKGLSGTTEKVKCLKLDAEFTKYRDKREKDLKSKILKIDPFRPRGSELIIRGNQNKAPSPKMPPVPQLLINAPVGPFQYTLYNVYAVRINNTIILKDIPGQILSSLAKMKLEPWHECCTTWSYYFNTPAKRAGRCKLFLQNLGTVTLRYCWKKIKRQIPFIPEEVYRQVYFFNKNEDVLSPGQRKEISFTFLSDQPGIYCEIWELHFCNICFFDSMSEKLCVNLCGDALENTMFSYRKCDILKHEIDTKAIFNSVSFIIKEVFDIATTIKPQIYPYKDLFLEAEIFVMKNPVCFYHQTEVMTMKNLYSEMLPGKIWNLSIKSWREAMIEKDFDDRMKYYELLRKSHTELLKPWYEGENLLQQKYRAIKQLLGQMADKFDEKYDIIVDLYSTSNEDNERSDSKNKTKVGHPIIDDLIRQKIRNVFYIHAYEYIATTMEMCAGVISSLDLNRWIEFDFCRL